MTTVTLPNRWQPRPYQLPAWTQLERGVKRVCLPWHRRSGKDDLALNWTAAASALRVGNYWHMLPQKDQARRAIWDAVIPQTEGNPNSGMKRIDQAFPREYRRRTRDNEMFIEFATGSTWQVLGSDNYQSAIGSSPIGIVFSEYAQADPNAWAFLRQIIRENDGWAMFISTPRGYNHFHGIYELSKVEPGWFGQLLTVNDTGIFTPEQIDQERREIAHERGDEEAESIVQQEYFCSFQAAIPGSYYGRLIAAAEKDRVGLYPYDPRLEVITAWDLGVGDPTAIWFVQQSGLGVRVIDYYENSGAGADHYARVLKDKGYNYAYHILPHDADDREWGNNASSRTDVLKGLGIKPLRIMQRASLDDGINAVRILLPRCYFNLPATERGLACLRGYQKEWDEKRKVFSERPLHDWTSHGADAFRYLAQGLKPGPTERGPDSNRQRTALM